MTELDRDFYDTDPVRLAKKLLNKVLVVRGGSGRIVETEAYAGATDPASHAYRKMSDRNEVMFGAPGGLYVYFTYGMHFCCNVVCEREGVASAVLIRAIEPIDDIGLMRRRRTPLSSAHGSRALLTDKALCNGPAKLCQALGIGRDDNGADLVTGDRGIRIVDDGTKPPRRPDVGPRIGITQGVDLLWRFGVPASQNVSKRFP